MSYDVSLYMDTGNGSTIEMEIGNYTYNCSMMLVVAIEKTKGDKGLSLSGMSGWDATKVADYLGETLDYMRKNVPEMEKMNPNNGWGDFETWCEYLDKIRLACIKHPLTKLSVT